MVTDGLENYFVNLRCLGRQGNFVAGNSRYGHQDSLHWWNSLSFSHAFESWNENGVWFSWRQTIPLCVGLITYYVVPVLYNILLAIYFFKHRASTPFLCSMVESHDRQGVITKVSFFANGKCHQSFGHHEGLLNFILSFYCSKAFAFQKQKLEA